MQIKTAKGNKRHDVTIQMVIASNENLFSEQKLRIKLRLHDIDCDDQSNS